MPEAREDTELEKLGPHDGILELWVGIAERSGFGFNVTLSVRGMLISGVLMSQADYMKGFGDDLAKAISKTGDEESAEAMRAMLTNKAEMVEAKRKRELERQMEGVPTGDSSESPINYIHLRDALIHMHPARYQIAYWRGRLDAVDGWALGSPSD